MINRRSLYGWADHHWWVTLVAVSELCQYFDFKTHFPPTHTNTVTYNLFGILYVIILQWYVVKLPYILQYLKSFFFKYMIRGSSYIYPYILSYCTSKNIIKSILLLTIQSWLPVVCCKTDHFWTNVEPWRHS